MKTLVAIGWCVLSAALHVRAQQGDGPGPNHIERLVLPEDEPENLAEKLEQLNHLLAHPVDLNKATADELRSTLLLSEFQISALLGHRARHGRILDLAELQTIDGFDEELIRTLSTCFRITAASDNIDATLLSRWRKESTSYVTVRVDHAFEKKQGFAPDADPARRFHGNPQRVLLRMRSYKPGDFSAGVTAEKDEGERFRWDGRKRAYGFDYAAFHLQLMNKGRIKNVVIGNYQAGFGQGLVCGGAGGFGKGAETITALRRSTTGFTPYTSAYESGYLHGVASTIAVSRYLTASAYYSAARRDAAAEDETEEISGVVRTGLHRNDSEYGKRKTIVERVAGAVVRAEVKNLSAGVIVQQTEPGASLQPRKLIYNGFAFRGSRLRQAGLFLELNRGNASFFAEAATSFPGTAGIAGVLVALSRKTDLSVLYRRYARNYHSLTGNAFGENMTAQNETGLYWGWKHRFSKRLSYSGYADLFEFPWLKFRAYFPSRGAELLSRLQWQPSRHTLIFIQARTERKGRNAPEEPTLHRVVPVAKTNYWIHAEYALSDRVSMRSRIQMSRFQAGRRTGGFMIAQDLTWHRNRWKVTARCAIIDTDDYDNRQYMYEHDVWLSYSMPAFYGNGVRRYVLAQFRVTRSLTVWLRYGHTLYHDSETLGAGIDEIKGNRRNDVKFEARFML